MRFGLRTFFLRIGVTTVAAFLCHSGILSPALSIAQSDSPTQVQTNKKTTEPVFRVSKLVTNDDDAKKDEEKRLKAEEKSQQPMERVADSGALPNSTPTVKPNNPGVAPHALDRAVDYAQKALEQMQTEVYDYTAVLAKRERINGVVGKPSYMSVKVRCPRVLPDGNQSPFSLYMKFLKPKDTAGREVIWVDGRNDGKLSAHQTIGPIKRRFDLDPTGFLAMRGQRYPIYEAGLENLIVKLIAKAERDRAAGPCEVNYREGAEINKRSCSMIELIHHDRREPYEFHKAQVFIDDELGLPVRFAAYDWPTSPGAKPQLIEEYTYYKVKVNVGLTDADFDPTNEAYGFPNR